MNDPIDVRDKALPESSSSGGFHTSLSQHERLPGNCHRTREGVGSRVGYDDTSDFPTPHSADAIRNADEAIVANGGPIAINEAGLDLDGEGSAHGFDPARLRTEFVRTSARGLIDREYLAANGDSAAARSRVCITKDAVLNFAVARRDGPINDCNEGRVADRRPRAVGTS